MEYSTSSGMSKVFVNGKLVTQSVAPPASRKKKWKNHKGRQRIWTNEHEHLAQPGAFFRPCRNALLEKIK